ncbi:NADH dehydrogenase [ubiquinone] 1 alpha subcomplex assembly factor 4 isoform X2 [Scomber scombrus]|uniref:NADH dehydrogenase [ubiquinone] 1 alpha subcomplex assembly factor 4 isoform X2 n=1 Tax=Scomber scombrus TaxID=13677 RepID=UPI002DDC3BC9|nr:NADH dehydrogenase [ubiquinone] 1 alpha subcomplex assembly factor 4 isoform X2 [Scomber scombrus]
MGARVARMFRNVNIENRVHREISKEKPRAAPRHTADIPEGERITAPLTESVHQKNDPLLALLKSVYVESKDPVAEAEEVTAVVELLRRPLKYSLPGDLYGLSELTDVPKGKLTIAEALKALSSHQRQPQTWTVEKISEEYCLNLKETQALVQFFMPFQVHIIPPKTDGVKQIKAS